MILSKKLLVLLPILLFTATLFGQKQQELGISFTSLNDFGIIYKKELKKETRYIRLSGANFSFLSNGNNFAFAGFDVFVGWENRRTIHDKFSLVAGPNVGLGINLVNDSQAGRVVSQIGFYFGYIIGGQYKLNDNFYIGLETIPQISTLFVGGRIEPVVSINGNTNFATLGIVYTFKKKEK